MCILRGARCQRPETKLSSLRILAYRTRPVLTSCNSSIPGLFVLPNSSRKTPPKESTAQNAREKKGWLKREVVLSRYSCRQRPFYQDGLARQERCSGCSPGPGTPDLLRPSEPYKKEFQLRHWLRI